MVSVQSQTELTSVSDPARFRQVLGHFASGVVVITAMTTEGPVGFTCASFSSLSLSPPLVLFCPRQGSWAWSKIREAEKFCINILHADQGDLCRTFASPSPDKFASLNCTPAGSGAPRLPDVLGWIDCALEDVVAGGDHDIAIGRVLDLGVASAREPLLYYRGDFGGFAAHPVPDWGAQA